MSRLDPAFGSQVFTCRSRKSCEPDMPPRRERRLRRPARPADSLNPIVGNNGPDGDRAQSWPRSRLWRVLKAGS